MDLTSCDREPIHIPGQVQPHGLLLTLRPEALSVLQVAGDVIGMLGREAAEIVNGDLEALLGAAVTAQVRSFAAGLSTEPLYLGFYPSPADAGRRLDLTAHVRDGVLVLEFEPAAPEPATGAEILSKVRKIGTALETANDFRELLWAASREMRLVTGFDRVMIYRFLEDDVGCVVAEDRIETLPTFLNHHYPPSDIPKQARALYLQNLIRVIPDAGYAPSPLIPPLNPVTDAPLDMSDCVLRSVSPIHIQYLKNMGVVASMSVSIVVDGRLWGLISCHHQAPKLVPYELRETCKHVGQILSHQIKASEDRELHQQAMHLAVARDELVQALSRDQGVEQGLLDRIAEMGRLIPSDGAAILVGSRIGRHGHGPDEPELRQLAEWLLRSSGSEPYATNSLVRDHAPAVAYAARASGLLATIVSSEEPILLMWFRAEHIETIEWAGNPHKPAEPDEELHILTPRKSFEVWKETVRYQSRPWSRAEVNGAYRFGHATRDLLQQQRLRELNVQLRRTLADKEVLLAQKDLLMQEVNHRVQNSLQLVNSMLYLQAQQSREPQVREQFEEASRRIMAVSTVHRRLWRRSDQIQNVDFGTYLEELRDDLLETWGEQWAEQVRIHMRHLLVPTDKAIILALVVTELLTNAVKYAYGGQPGPIDVSIREEGLNALRITVQDRGVGMGKDLPKGGLGSRLIRSLVTQLNGELQVSSRATGTSVSLTVPCRQRRLSQASRRPEARG